MEWRYCLAETRLRCDRGPRFVPLKPLVIKSRPRRWLSTRHLEARGRLTAIAIVVMVVEYLVGLLVQ